MFKIAAGLVSLCYSVARVCFACVELACDSADWLIGRAEKRWQALTWRALGGLARVVWSERELR